MCPKGTFSRVGPGGISGWGLGREAGSEPTSLLRCEGVVHRANKHRDQGQEKALDAVRLERF